MFKPLLFYTIAEYTSVEKYCKRKRLVPHRTVVKSFDNKPFPVVTQYKKDGYIYDVLGYSECYSGCMVTLMRLPPLPFQGLLKVALASRSLDERAGAIGMILKKYLDEFEDYLEEANQNPFLHKNEKKQIARITKFILDSVYTNTSYVQDMDRLRYLCKAMSSRTASK